MGAVARVDLGAALDEQADHRLSGAYLEVLEDGEDIRLRKLVRIRPLGSDDPIWDLVGAGESGAGDVSANHDRHLADGETAR